MDWVAFLNDVIAPLMNMLSGKYGFVAEFITIMGTLRLMLKPIMTALQFYFGYLDTNPQDRVWLNNFMNSKWYPAIQFLLDWFASVKLPPPPTQNTPTPPPSG